MPLPTRPNPHKESVRCWKTVFANKTTAKRTNMPGTTGYPQVRYGLSRAGSRRRKTKIPAVTNA